MILLALVLLTTGHRFANGFVFDDVSVIEQGEVIHDISRVPDVFTNRAFVVSSLEEPEALAHVDTYRPVTLLTFFWDSALSGRSPWAYHLTNLLLHLLCVFLLYQVTLRLLANEEWPFALFGATLFALNPWTAEAHVWINGRSDLCGLALGLCCLWLALREPGRRQWLVSSGIFVVFLGALLSKEVMLGSAPALVLSPLLRPSKTEWSLWTRLRGIAIPVAMASALYLWLRHVALGDFGAHPDADMLWLVAQRLPILLLDGVQASWIPREAYLRSLSEEYAALPAWVAGAAALALIAIAALCLRLRNRWPVLPWALLWYLGTLAPAAVITTLLWPGFGRYLYVPGAATAWIAATGLAKLWPVLRPTLRPLCAGAGLIYLLAASLFLVRHTASYHDEIELYSRAIAMKPEVAYGWGFLGPPLTRAGRHEEAVKVLQEAVRRAPQEQRYRARLAHALIDVGRRDEARALADKGAADFAGTREAASFHLALARSLPSRDPARVVFHLVRCLELRPGRTDCEAALSHLVTEAPDAEENRTALEALLGEPEYASVRAFIACRLFDRCDRVEPVTAELGQGNSRPR